ncbi:hypothetical protein R3I93_015871 [Phoxinus phoxinus]|uniref:Uncharacterized protein n=1 Tax=Phoxinus phoxinus TaxID=58324 RepID=A0AAN9GYE6_9TELE
MTLDSTRHTSEPDRQNRGGDCEGSSDRDQKEQRFFRLIRGEECEDEEPAGKRRHVAHYTQEYDRPVLKTPAYQNNMVPETQAFFHGATVKRRVLTSRPVTQTPRRWSAECGATAAPRKRTGKENYGPGSPERRIGSSPAESSVPEKHTLLSPEKCVSAGDTLASLFTQDSEGLCVIAHRDQHSLQEDKSVCSVSVCSVSSVCGSGKEEEEEEMLFTQDSEGNMVIKH